MIPFAAPPPPRPAQQIVIKDARTNTLPAVNPSGSGGKLTFANRHERRHYMSLVRRELRRRWRGAERAKLNALIVRHERRLSITRTIRAMNNLAASASHRTPVSA